MLFCNYKFEAIRNAAQVTVIAAFSITVYMETGVFVVWKLYFILTIYKKYFDYLQKIWTLWTVNNGSCFGMAALSPVWFPLLPVKYT